MGGIFKVIGGGLKAIVLLVGGAVWLGGVALIIYGVWNGLAADTDAAAPVRIGLAIFGIVLAGVISLVLLRLTGKITTFLLCVLFGGVALAGAYAAKLPAFGAVDSLGLLLPVGGGLLVLLIAGAIVRFTDRMTILLYCFAALGVIGGGALSMMSGRAGAPAEQASPSLGSAAPTDSPAADDGRTDDGLKRLQADQGDAVDAAQGAPAASEESLPPPADAPALGAQSPEADQFHVGKLSFNKPTEMRLQQPYIIEAEIASAPVGASNLGDVGKTVTVDTKITRKVRVELIAPDFKVEKQGEGGTLLITPQTPGRWSWKVTPQREGDGRKMQLRVLGVIEENGVAQGDTLITTHEETILVTVTPIDKAKLIANAVIESWQTIGGIFGVLGGLWVFFGNIVKSVRRRKEPVTA